MRFKHEEKKLDKYQVVELAVTRLLLKTVPGMMGVWDKLSYENFVPFHQVALKEDPNCFGFFDGFLGILVFGFFIENRIFLEKI